MIRSGQPLAGCGGGCGRGRTGSLPGPPQCQVNYDTGEPRAALTSEAVAFCRKLKSQSTRLSDVLHLHDTVVMEFISRGIQAVNEEAPSASARIIKWALLDTDFSVGGGELGEQPGGQRSWPVTGLPAPHTWAIGLGHVALASKTYPSPTRVGHGAETPGSSPRGLPLERERRCPQSAPHSVRPPECPWSLDFVLEVCPKALVRISQTSGLGPHTCTSKCLHSPCSEGGCPLLWWLWRVRSLYALAPLTPGSPPMDGSQWSLRS